jgi:sugar phosphate isomerase/epimerase
MAPPLFRAQPPLSRREFLGLSGAGLLAMARSGRASDEFLKPRVPQQPNRVTLAISTRCCGKPEEADFARALEVLPKAGFSSTEFDVTRTPPPTAESIRQLKTRSAQAGLKPIGLQTGPTGGADAASVRSQVEAKLQLLDRTRELGCSQIKFGAGPRGSAGAWEGLHKVVAELAPAAREKEVLLLLENQYHTQLETAEDCENLFERVDSPYVGLCVDPGHFTASAQDLDDVLFAVLERVYQVDLRDCAKVGEPRWARLGEGVVDFEEFLEELLDEEYVGYLVVDQDPGEPAALITDLQKARARFRRFTKA